MTTEGETTDDAKKRAPRNKKDPEDYDFAISIAVVGDVGVGKSSVIECLCCFFLWRLSDGPY